MADTAKLDPSLKFSFAGSAVSLACWVLMWAMMSNLGSHAEPAGDLHPFWGILYGLICMPLIPLATGAWVLGLVAAIVSFIRCSMGKAKFKFALAALLVNLASLTIPDRLFS